MWGGGGVGKHVRTGDCVCVCACVCLFICLYECATSVCLPAVWYACLCVCICMRVVYVRACVWRAPAVCVVPTCLTVCSWRHNCLVPPRCAAPLSAGFVPLSGPIAPPAAGRTGLRCTADTPGLLWQVLRNGQQWARLVLVTEAGDGGW